MVRYRSRAGHKIFTANRGHIGKEYLAQLREQGVLPVTEETEKEKNLRRTMAPRRASI